MNCYEKAVEKFGPQVQKDKACEELAELLALLLKERNESVPIEDLISEIADVENTIKQLIIIFDIHDEVEVQKMVKMEKLKL